MTHKGEGTTPLVMNATGAWQRPVNWILSKTHARTQESIAKRGRERENKNKMKRENSAWFFNLAAAAAWAFQLTSKTSQVLFYFYFFFILFCLPNRFTPSPRNDVRHEIWATLMVYCALPLFLWLPSLLVVRSQGEENWTERRPNVCTANTKGGEKKSSISESESYGNAPVEIVTRNAAVAFYFTFTERQVGPVDIQRLNSLCDSLENDDDGPPAKPESSFFLNSNVLS